jgi:hypothetical protein
MPPAIRTGRVPCIFTTIGKDFAATSVLLA